MNNILTLVLIAIFSNSLFAQKKVQLSGEFKSAEPNEVLYLNLLDDVVDSTIVKNGMFSFNLSGYPAEEYLLSRKLKNGDMQFILLYLDSCNTQLTISDSTYSAFNNIFMHHQVTGNPTHETVAKVNEVFFSRDFLQKVKTTEFLNLLDMVAKRGDLGAAMVFRKYGMSLAQMIPSEKMSEYINALSPQVKASSIGKELLDRYSFEKSLSGGGKAPNFIMDTPTGEKIDFYEFIKGKKVILVDFWASWCGPCRKKNPEIVAFYNENKEKGFDVIGVSLDNDLERWKKAINDDNLSWTHVSDLKGWKSEICGKYNFRGIPHLLLVNGNGDILATDSDLHNQLAGTISNFLK
ncbi:MAG: AhpC/TSA family protein [Sphingobacterium sp.]|jgi:thiol-disulfide isomerase/thioredoxin|nr:AhpC/TSA family protein [Sphingobacterium sp.]